MNGKSNIIFGLKAISELNNLHFIVAPYQRGYKWNIEQIKDLLNDINSFELSEQGFYCLQPIVLKELVKDREYELIDGQQRLTSIFIILKALKKAIFNISYQTRKTSEAFLKKIEKIPKQQIDINTNTISITKQLNKYWENYLTNNTDNDNVDNYHFYCAYQYIQNWIEGKREYIEAFLQKLIDYTKVIWYNIQTEETPEQIFINFNYGKIPLVQAELIKALFVLQLKTEPNKELQGFKLNQFSDEWNYIENKLQEDSFWFFISNDTSDKNKSNRIDVLFDIEKNKPKKHNDKLYAYRKYLIAFESENEKTQRIEDPLEWFKIKNLFDILVEWYNNRTIYHLIGFIIYNKITTINDLIKHYNNREKIKNKKQFKTYLVELIKKEFNKDKYQLDNINYQTPKEASSVLLFFNILLYEQSDYSYRFPFFLFKNTSWSLEHIHAQNSEKFTTIKEVKDWVSDIDLLINDFKNTKEYEQLTINNLQAVKKELNNQNKTTEDINRNFKILIKELDTEITQVFNKDNLDNLCLLDSITNSSFNNDIFINKRAKLLDIDAGRFEYSDNKNPKAFIPLGTKNVFLKYYTKDASSLQMSFWGFEDRKNYTIFIQKTLKTFFKNLNISNNE